MNVNNVGSSAPVQKVTTPPVQKAGQTEATHATRASDRLELSGVSHLLKTLKTNGDVRTDKIAQIKAQIEAGSYEDDAKLDLATDHLLDDLLK